MYRLAHGYYLVTLNQQLRQRLEASHAPVPVANSDNSLQKQALDGPARRDALSTPDCLAGVHKSDALASVWAKIDAL